MKNDTSEYIVREMWAETFASLSLLEQRIVVSIAIHAISASNIAISCLADRRCVDNSIRGLLSAGLLSVNKEVATGSVYELIPPGFVAYCKQFDRAMLYTNAVKQVTNEIHALVVKRFEALEHLALINGNGHHLAQNISAEVESILRKRWLNSAQNKK
jgi:hypothetical protein